MYAHACTHEYVGWFSCTFACAHACLGGMCMLKTVMGILLYSPVSIRLDKVLMFVNKR